MTPERGMGAKQREMSAVPKMSSADVCILLILQGKKFAY
jgi:hypothetical protein